MTGTSGGSGGSVTAARGSGQHSDARDRVGGEPKRRRRRYRGGRQRSKREGGGGERDNEAITASLAVSGRRGAARCLRTPPGGHGVPPAGAPHPRARRRQRETRGPRAAPLPAAAAPAGTRTWRCTLGRQPWRRRPGELATVAPQQPPRAGGLARGRGRPPKAAAAGGLSSHLGSTTTAAGARACTTACTWGVRGTRPDWEGAARGPAATDGRRAGRSSTLPQRRDLPRDDQQADRKLPRLVES